MNQIVATFSCILAVLALGFADLHTRSTSSCATSGFCCCGSAPLTPDPCLCGEPPEIDLPQIATFVALASLTTPSAEAIAPALMINLADLAPTWHPAQPWHAPPTEKRARLSVWIL